MTLRTFGFSEWIIPIIGASASLIAGTALRNGGYKFWACASAELIIYIPFAFYGLRYSIIDFIRRGA